VGQRTRRGAWSYWWGWAAGGALHAPARAGARRRCSRGRGGWGERGAHEQQAARGKVPWCQRRTGRASGIQRGMDRDFFGNCRRTGPRGIPVGDPPSTRTEPPPCSRRVQGARKRRQRHQPKTAALLRRTFLAAIGVVLVLLHDGGTFHLLVPGCTVWGRCRFGLRCWTRVSDLLVLAATCVCTLCLLVSKHFPPCFFLPFFCMHVPWCRRSAESAARCQ